MSGYSDDRRFYLDHIHFNAAAAQQFVDGMTFGEFSDDLKTQYACERAILSLSEAVRDLEKVGKDEDTNFRLTDISDAVNWKEAKKMGDVLRHDYENVAAEKTWITVTEFLPMVEVETQLALQHYSAFYDQEPAQARDEPEQEP